MSGHEDQRELKVGSGWSQLGQPLWLLESVEAGHANLVRWRAVTGGELQREEVTIRGVKLLEGQEAWYQVPDEQVQQLMEALTRTPAGDAVASLMEAEKRQGEAAANTVKAREESASRLARAQKRHQSMVVPAPASEWVTYASVEGSVPSAGELRAVAEQPPLVEPKTITLSYRELSGLEAHSPGADALPVESRPNAQFEERAGLVPPRVVRFPHDFPGAPGHDPENPGECFTSNCSYGCGAWCGPSRSSWKPDGTGIDPGGECEMHPELLAIGAPGSTQRKRWLLNLPHEMPDADVEVRWTTRLAVRMTEESRAVVRRALELPASECVMFAMSLPESSPEYVALQLLQHGRLPLNGQNTMRGLADRLQAAGEALIGEAHRVRAFAASIELETDRVDDATERR